MKKFVFSFLITALVFVVWSKNSDGQIINGAYKRTDTYQKKPMIIPMVREADVFWSQMIWRIIDVREKINQPLFYPTKSVDGLQSLIEILLEGIRNQTITAYDARNDDDFKIPLSNFNEVKVSFGAVPTTKEVTNFDTGEKEMRTDSGEIRMNEVKQFMIKEEWYFDKQNSRLQVRIVGICPIQEYLRDGDPSGQVQRRKVFWVYYPEARELLAKSPVFNFQNDARRMTYDDLFLRRYFNSYIVQESNVFNNRAINQYLSGKSAMLESKKIEDKIFNFEQDLWEY
ncbi:MAG TPA: gliding motility protein GldN [Prolixibacteraceae bacterium]|nr:gliding motility protein GldN [Prolixibacteraceae bacterium]HPT31702.1 gliding motility protein GldN [Prolixibacteraceae bacterium]